MGLHLHQIFDPSASLTRRPRRTCPSGPWYPSLRLVEIKSAPNPLILVPKWSEKNSAQIKFFRRYDPTDRPRSLLRRPTTRPLGHVRNLKNVVQTCSNFVKTIYRQFWTKNVKKNFLSCRPIYWSKCRCQRLSPMMGELREVKIFKSCRNALKFCTNH